MKISQWKNSVRNIRKTLISWIAIVTVTMIGAGVYSGVSFYADSLAEKGEKFLSQTEFEDLSVVAPIGLDDEDISALKEMNIVTDAEGGYYIPDARLHYSGGTETVTLYTLSEKISKPVLVSGTLPSAGNECALTASAMEKYWLNPGDTVKINIPDENIPEGFLRYEDLTVTGAIEHAEGICTEYSRMVFVPVTAFDGDKINDNYTYVRIIADTPISQKRLSDEYENTVDLRKKDVDDKLSEIGKNHDSKIREDAADKISDAEKKAADSEDKLNSARKELEEKEKELTEKEALIGQYGESAVSAEELTAIQNARKEINEKKAELSDNEKKLEESKEQIAEKKKELEELKDSHYGTMTQNSKEGFLTYKTDVKIIHDLSMIFVILFLIIGAIVIASTVTILINQKKKQLGMMKANGFDKKELAFEFIIYTNTAVMIGLILAVGLAWLLQFIISSVNGGLFCVRTDSFSFFIGNYIVLALCMLLVGNISAVIVLARKLFATEAVDLMSGNTDSSLHSGARKKRHVFPLYSRLIARNMVSELPRIVTSVAVIGGCCLIMGLGVTLKDSLDNVMKYMARDIMHYDLEVSVYSRSDDPEKVRAFLSDKGAEYKEIRKTNTIYKYEDTEEHVTVISCGSELYGDYIMLGSRSGNETYSPAGSDLIADFKTAEKLGLSKGNELILRNAGFEEHTFVISGICMNYYPRVMYLGEEAYDELFGSSTYDTMVVRAGGIDAETLGNELSEKFPDIDITYTDRLPQAFTPMSDMFHVVVYILIVLSVIMSVFVLLNLVNIFVRRKKNEIIIMAVNGFDHKEQIGYLLRETIITTVCGLIAGVLAGWAMTEPVVRTVEVGEMLFVRDFNVIAWIIATGMEAVFAIAINFFAFRYVRSFDITELTH